MTDIEKSHVEADSSSFEPLPDDVVLQIFRKLDDLKTLCCCKPVSKRFYRIILQVDTISFITKPRIFFSSFLSVIRSLSIFGGLKSLCIQIPYSRADCPLYKWKIKFGGKLDSFIFLSPTSIYGKKELYVNANGQEQEEDEDMELKVLKHCAAVECLKKSMMRHFILLSCIKSIPSLEKVSIMDWDKRWKVSASRVKVTEMRNDSTSPSESLYMRLELGCRVSRCYVPLLELPISGYVMKGVTLFLMERDNLPEDEYDSFWKSVDADFEEKEEAAYCEAVMEIFKNHMGRIERLNHLTADVDFNM
ncbi:F-box domain, Leucine-rich repeat domain, L domain-like protein [Artemisia annua]|uniref:F-box domain, Leucine-rich repeat domain, L domain-like protein n=1 Tax=Artemisia annua TaxID=35608 RepID=A0A2U1N933_ARTAN|nr:F-box domain, Leucine-rich repeat domain, L domain-like protein [Artemisia annua]